MAVVRQRAALVLNLHQQASDLDAQQQRLDGQRRSAQDAQQAATEAAARREAAAKDLGAAARDWLRRVTQWRDAVAAEGSTVELELPAVDELVADPGAARALAGQARQAITPLLNQAREAEHGLARRRAEIQQRIDAHQAELAGLRAGGEREPEPPRYATQPRDPAGGAPFYRLVDFHPDLTTVQRADLEAAIQASGLLNAWVSATGEVRADARGEVFATVHGPALADGGLAEVLVPATDADCPVPADVVAALLARISTTTSADSADSAGLAVSPTGHWRAGALAGAWSKPAAEFIGAGAREAARRQRISLLDEELRALRSELAGAGGELAEARERVSAWERRIEEFPGDGELIAGHGRLQATEEAAERALHQALALREQAEAAQGRWEAARGELARHAGAAGLSSPTTEALRQARQATQDAQHSAERLAEALRRQCRNTLNDLVTAGHTHQAAIADRTTAEREAEARCRSYVAGAARLAELSKAVGGEAKQVADTLRELEQGRGRLREELRQVRERVADLREQAAKLDALLGTARDALAGAEANHERAKEAFRQAAAAPGIVAAAFPALETLPDTDDLAAVRAAIAEAGNRRGAVESNVLAKLQALQTSLSGSHDITAEHHAGLLTVTVTGEDGPRPVAVAARQVSAKLAEQRGFLDERYQDIFADYLIRDVAESLREQIAVAEDLSRRMNEVLARARSSQGVHVKLTWKTSAALDEDTRQALELVRMPFGERTPEQDALLRRMFTERIELERGSASGGYAEILARALDYRSWYEFKVTVADTGPDGRSRERRLRQLSSGETRLVSYVTLFAAAASFYDAVGDGAAGFDPLRLVLLDEAFERLDDPTIQRMLGLLVDLDMDWVITWPSGWGVSEKIPRMHIYDVLRPRAGGGVACTQTTWDGAGLDRVDP